MNDVDNSMLEMADRLRELREEKKERDAALKALNAEIEEANERLVEMMVDAEMQKFDRAGKLFYLSTRTYASPIKGQQDTLYMWFKENGYADLVRETVYAQSLSAFVKELIEEDDELPAELAELLNVYEKTSVNIRNS